MEKMSKIDSLGSKVFSLQAISSAVNSLFAPIASKVAGSKLKVLNNKKNALIKKISQSQQLQSLLNDYLSNKSSKAANALMRSSGFGNDMWIAEKEMNQADNSRIKLNTIINKGLDGLNSKLTNVNNKINYISGSTGPFSAIVRSSKTNVE